MLFVSMELNGANWAVACWATALQVHHTNINVIT